MTDEPCADAGIDAVLGALRHVGPCREALLRESGRTRWGDLLSGTAPPRGVPQALWDAIRRDAVEALALLARRDWPGLCRRLPGREQWRVLAAASGRVSHVDIETDGLEGAAGITAITCLHRGRLHCFNRSEGLDGFLDLLEDVEVLASFNGSGFDVPRILRWFHIPELPCAHLDLRWICHHAGLRGGLKQIEHNLGLGRPADLEGIDGLAAVRLWALWENTGHSGALRQLVRYCAADTVALPLLAQRLLAGHGLPLPDAVRPEALWSLVPVPPDDAADVLRIVAAADASAVAGAAAAPCVDRDARRSRLARQWRLLQSAARRTERITTGV